MANIATDSLSDLVNLECSICNESVFFQRAIPVQIQQCNHVFHKECLHEWCRRTRMNACSCPLCRVNFNFRRGLRNVKTQMKRRIRASEPDDINNITYSSEYDQQVIVAIRNEIAAIKNDANSPVSTLRTSDR